MDQFTVKMHRAHIARETYGLNLEKNFFELSGTELTTLLKFKMICNFRGNNNLGRSPLRQFYYHLQAGNAKLPF